MKLPDLPLTGSCRCGAVHVEITMAPLMTAACHCKGCQKMSASAYSLTMMIPLPGFSVTKGVTERGGIGHGQLSHQFCPHCKTWMFTGIEGLDAFLNVRPTMFDDISWFSPFIETMTKEKLGWATTPAVHSFAEFPPAEAYPSLMSEFAGQGR